MFLTRATQYCFWGEDGKLFSLHLSEAHTKNHWTINFVYPPGCRALQAEAAWMQHYAVTTSGTFTKQPRTTQIRRTTAQVTLPTAHLRHARFYACVCVYMVKRGKCNQHQALNGSDGGRERIKCCSWGFVSRKQKSKAWQQLWATAAVLSERWRKTCQVVRKLDHEIPVNTCLQQFVMR